MTIKRRFSLPFWILLIILELVGAVIVVVDLGDYAYDDAYIYLNGARQLSRGELPDMTPGEELSTNSWASHLWLALITPAFWLGVDPLWWAKILGMLLLGGVIAQLAALLRRFLSGLPRWKTIAAAGVSLLFAPLILGALNALETLLCVFSLLWLLRWAVAYLEPDGDSVAQTRATLYLGLIAGLHLLTRPDAFVEVLFVLALTTLVTIRRRAAVSARFSRLALGLLPGTAIFVLVWVLYGSPLPTSAGVKILDFGRLADPWFWRMMLERLGGEFVRTPGLLALYLGLFALLIRWSAKTEAAPTTKKPPRRPRLALRRSGPIAPGRVHSQRRSPGCAQIVVARRGDGSGGDVTPALQRQRKASKERWGIRLDHADRFPTRRSATARTGSLRRLPRLAALHHPALR